MNAPKIENIDTIRTIVLDLDGTLYDKSGLAKRLIISQLLHLPLLAAERKKRKQLKGQDFGSEEAFYDVFFRKMAENRCFSAEKARKWYFGKYMPAMVRALERSFRAYSWVDGAVAQWKQRGIRVAVYSDYGAVPEKLRALGLDPEMFDLVISAPQLGGLKPSAQSAERLLKFLNANPAETLFIGDRRDTDGASAEVVGANFLISDSKFHISDYGENTAV